MPRTKTYTFRQAERVTITMKDWKGSREATVNQFSVAGANDLVTVRVLGKDGQYGNYDFKARSLKQS